MKRKKDCIKISRMLLTLLVSVCAICAWADSEINVEKAGTLQTLLPTSDAKLKITGSINGTDVRYLRELISAGTVTSLDLSGVNIVSGGEAYFGSYKTENDVIGKYMFQDFTKLKTILLPSNLKSIKDRSFSGCGITEIDIPNSVTSIGEDAFAYCNSLKKVIVGNSVRRMEQGAFYCSPVSKFYMKPVTPPAMADNWMFYNPEGTITFCVYTSSLTDYKNSEFKSYGTVTGNLEKTYPMEVDSYTNARTKAGEFFEDVACTQLKPAYQAMTDEELTKAFTEAGMPDFMINIAIKVKDGQWAKYEQDFRIHSYKAYSDANYWNNKMKSTGGSYMGNPTGIYAKNDGDEIYVFVDSDIPSDATLYFAGCVENQLIYSAKTGQKLVKGLNIIDGTKDALYYILYTADTESMKKTLDQWPEIKIHVEGGVVNGYYDVTRRSDADYKAILKAATHNRFTVKGGQSLFNFKTASYRSVFPSTIDKSILWFDSVAVWQKELMGFCESVATGKRAGAPFYLTGGDAIFPIYYNNPNFAIEGEEEDDGYANSTDYRTSYNGLNCIKNCMNANNPEMDDNCAAHECGHNNQGAINLEGGTEVSNSLFTFLTILHDGLNTPTGAPLSTVMEDFAHHVPYYFRSGNNAYRMYWQLYLYYHMAQKDTSFYPRLFKALREDPLKLYNSSNNRNGGLKFVRKVCEVAQEDLTDFFTIWGFFEPIKATTIEDYGRHNIAVTQSDINSTKAAIAKYPKKNREIIFIDERVEYLPTTNFLASKAGEKRRGSDQVGQCGDVGQFSSYLPGASKPSEYTYFQSDSLYALEGEGGLGFVMLDGEGKLKYAAKSKNFCIPTNVGTDWTIYSYDEGGVLHEVPKAGDGTVYVNLVMAGTLKRKLENNQAIKLVVSGSINANDISYMKQLVSTENLQSIDLEKSRTSNFSSNAFQGIKKLVSIKFPSSLTSIGSDAFSRTGLNTVVIPDKVTSVGGDAFAYCDNLNSVVIGEKVRTLDQGVFYESKIKDAYVKAHTPPSISAYLFSSEPTIHVYSQDLAKYQKSAWAEFGTIVGDLENCEVITAIDAPNEEISSVEDSDGAIYNLQGMKVSELQAGSIYIQNGQKIIK